MKLKKEYIVLLLIIIALSVYLTMRSTDRTHYQLPELTGLERDKITKIEISKEENAIVLIKRDNQWYLEPEGYLADTGKIDDMLAVFESLSLAALVSESKDYQRYDLHPAGRITARAWQDDTLKRTLDIGKAAPSFRHTFVKLADDSRVYHANDNFRSKFEQTPDSLRDRGVLSFNAGDIQAVQITKDQASIELVRNEVTIEPAASQPEKPETAPPATTAFEWQERNGKKGNDQILKRLLTTLGSLKCSGYIDDRNKEAFTEPIYSVKLNGIQEHQLEIFAKLEKDAEHYPAASSGSDYPFLLPDNQAQQIMQDPAQMLSKSEADKKTSEAQKSE
ncbi:MAG: DUF4340 domain-containing protein [Deltaproteobacteria bacterium]|nr:DUF4340 domain-containing protein [Deltaproteobacteria bacterium]